MKFKYFMMSGSWSDRYTHILLVAGEMVAATDDRQPATGYTQAKLQKGDLFSRNLSHESPLAFLSNRLPPHASADCSLMCVYCVMCWAQDSADVQFLKPNEAVHLSLMPSHSLIQVFREVRSGGKEACLLLPFLISFAVSLLSSTTAPKSDDHFYIFLLFRNETHHDLMVAFSLPFDRGKREEMRRRRGEDIHSSRHMQTQSQGAHL